MTIADAAGILRGADNAATQYLYNSTYDKFFALYRPEIEISLNTKLVGNISTAQSWEKLTNRWNEIADSLVGQVAGLNPVENNLVVYPTNEALDGLFLKIENIFR